eukprot:maker-scaffold511_size151351-snap-gene-0.30 protein:Tk01189 transcript:maker-scaffold511_size151351-snap-gene-0.30-mRNA-1 annotation:"---NA---"
MKAFVTVVSLLGVLSQSGLGAQAMPQAPPAAAAAASAATPPPPPPLYFSAPPSVETGEDCKTLADGEDKPTFNYPPFFVAPENTNICVYSIGEDWKFQSGFAGNCNGDCCEYIAPNEDGMPSDEATELAVKWHSIGEDDEDCDIEKALAQAQIMKGEFRETASICHNSRDNPEVFEKSTVELQVCSNSCCIFAPGGALVPYDEEK